MQIKTATLTSPALDWAVAECENNLWLAYENALLADRPVPPRPSEFLRDNNYSAAFAPSTDWAQGGPIIERENIATSFDREWVYGPGNVHPDDEPDNGDRWLAALDIRGDQCLSEYGPTLLVTAMRCYVASKLGDTVDIPDKLIP